MRRGLAGVGWPIGLALIVVALCARDVVAEPAREVIQLVYDAPSECPDRAVLVGAVRARTHAALLTTAPWASRRFTVTITQGNAGYVGALDVDGGRRDLSAPRCDDLIAAMALVIAVAIDPRELIAPPEPEAPAAPSPPRNVPVRPARPSGLRAMAVTTLGSGGGTGGITPGAALTTTLEGRLGWRGVGHLGVTALLAWDGTELEMGDARFTWLAARGSACWQWWQIGIEADACGHVETGAVIARGRDVVGAQRSIRLWLAPGAHLAIRWPKESKIFAELQAGASFPLQRDRFYIAPATTVHETWAMTPWVTLGIGVRFRGSK